MVDSTAAPNNSVGVSPKSYYATAKAFLGYASSPFSGIRIGDGVRGHNGNGAIPNNTINANADTVTLDEIVHEPEIDPQLKEILDNPAWDKFSGRERERFLIGTLESRGYCNLSGSYYNPKGDSHIFTRGGKTITKIDAMKGIYFVLNGSLPDDIKKIFGRAGLRQT